MKPTLTTLALLFVCAAATTMPTEARAEQKVVRTIKYKWKTNDSCYAIAQRVYSSRNGIRYIHQYNPWMGKLPHRLKPGTELTLPIFEQTADAQLTKKRGPVRVKPSRLPSWRGAQSGMDLFRAWRVNSRKRATAEVTFVDKSRVFMRENTLVIIYGKSNSSARISSTRAHLERGTLRARLAELDGKPNLQVTTDSSDTNVKNSDLLVSVDTKKTARFANHKGGALRVRSRGRRRGRVAIRAGWGTKVIPNRKPTKPKRLPPPPAWNIVPRFALGVGAAGATIHGSWKSVANAASYRVTLTQDVQGVDLIAAITVPAATTQFEAHGLPPGRFYVHIASIDNDKFEGIRSRAQPFDVRIATATQPGGVATRATMPRLGSGQLPAPMKAPKPPRVLMGTTISVPTPLRCGTGSGPFVLRKPGPARVDCTDGVFSVALRFDVVGLSAAVAEAAAVALPRTRTTSIRIKLTSVVGIPTVRVVAPAGVTVGPVSKPTDDVLHVPITPAANAPKQTTLRIVTGSGATQTVLATVSLAIADVQPVPVVAREIPAAAKTPLLRLAVFAGATLFSEDHNLGNSADPSVTDSTAHVGLRVSVPLQRWIENTLEFGFGRPRLSSGESAKMLVWRVGATIPLLSGRLVPLLATTVGARTLFANDSIVATSDTDVEFGWGLGLRYKLANNFGLRADVRHIVASGLTNFFEFSVGFYRSVGTGFAE